MGDWWQRHSTGAIVVAAVVVVGGVWWVDRPTVPTVVIADVRAQGASPAIWYDTGADGRPDGPLRLTTRIRADFPADARVDIRGLTGPGVSDPGPEETLDEQRRGVSLRAEIDCTAVPATLDPQAYAVAAVVRTAEVSEPVRLQVGGGEEWPSTIASTCAAWRATAALTVVTATATPDPARPDVALAMRVRNDGTEDLTVTSRAAYGLEPATGPVVTVPVGGEVEIDLALKATWCDAVVGAEFIIPRDTPTMVAPLGPLQADVGGGMYPLAHTVAAAQALQDGFAATCGGLGPVVLLVPPGSADLDSATRTLRMPVSVFTTPGLVTRLRVKPPIVEDETPWAPLWQPTDWAAPDPSGWISVDLGYRSVQTDGCATDGWWLPSPIIEVEVPGVGDGPPRILQFRPVLDLWQEAPLLALLCL